MAFRGEKHVKSLLFPNNVRADESFYVTLPFKSTQQEYSKKMKKTFLGLTIIILSVLSACTEKAAQFHIEGHIAGAKDSTLYLEALTLNDGVQTIDSAKLGEDGAFCFAYSDTTSCPEFYRLRIAGQVINLSVDSTETIGVEAKWPDMAFNYRTTGSGNCDTIRILSLKLADLERRIVEMSENRSYTLDERDLNIMKMLKEYKDTVKIWYIQNNYEKASSYYALFQMVNGMGIFDVENDASDVTWVGAVANSWSEHYPGSLRTQNLINIAMRGRRNTHKRVVELNVDNDKVKETGIIDMEFPDITGKGRRLSDLKGNVVLLDFTAYRANGSQERTIRMRSLYEKYHGRGLEIYQVSLDPDIHYWKTVSKNLPWVCVFCEEGPSSDIITIYQVQQLGTYFLIDRDNNLVSRAENITYLEKEIEKLL